MARVKASKQHRYVAVKYQPHLRVLVPVAVCMGLVVCLIGGYYLGARSGKHAAGAVQLESARHELEKVQLIESLEVANQKLVNIQTSAQVDKLSGEQVRQELKTLRDELARLEEDNRFYRNLMSPKNGKASLDLSPVTLLQTGDKGVWNYSFTIQQIAKAHDLVSGTLVLEVNGLQFAGTKDAKDKGTQSASVLQGKARSLKWSELAQEGEISGVKLRFRYFQRVEGQLELPSGFVPAKLLVRAKTTGKNGVALEKLFDWTITESES